MNFNLISIVIALTLITSAFGMGYHLGKQSYQVKEQKAVIQTQEKQNQAVKEVQQQEVKRQIVYRDRLKVIHDATDNCLDVAAPDSVLRTLRSSP